MKRVLLGLLAAIGLFFVVLVVVDQIKLRSGPDSGEHAPSNGEEPGARSTQTAAPIAPTPASERTIQLALALPEPEASAVVQLLPTEDQLVEGDAYILYEKACNAVPAELDDKVLFEWGRMKPDGLPLDRVESLLEQSEQALSLVDQGILCTDCNWPAAAVGAQLTSLRRYRTLAQVIRLKAAYEIADSHPMEAVQALRMGFALARHVGQGPTLNHGMAGIAIGALTCRQIPNLAEQPGSVSLYAALEGLPAPLVSLEEVIQAELDNLDKDPKVNFLNRRAFLNILEPAHERCRFLARRFDRDLKAVQCLEAIRLHAAAHNGTLPSTLSQITPWKVPQDPVNGRPFVYALSGHTAILESPASPDDPRSRLQYEITLKQAPSR